MTVYRILLSLFLFTLGVGSHAINMTSSTIVYDKNDVPPCGYHGHDTG